MTAHRAKPGDFTQVPRGKNGLVGRTAVDMREGNPWGELVALRQGSSNYWRFRCPQGHEPLMSGVHVRRLKRTGKPIVCPDCRAAAQETRWHLEEQP